jgi:hypothetical protein
MKWVAGVLLAANLAVAGFFVFGERWWRTGSDQAMPMNIDRLSLRGHSRSSSEAPPSRHAENEAEALCVEWRGLSLDEFRLVRDQLKALVGERVMSFTEVLLNAMHWVIFPPLPSADSAAAKLGELVAAGVLDAYVVKTAKWKNAISLGLYANGEVARRRIAEVESMGVPGAQVVPQPKQGTEFYFVIRSEDPDALKSLSDIRRAYPNSRLSRVACPS